MRLRSTVRLLVLCVASADASFALAHEGHGDPKWYGTPLHYLIEPEHMPVALAVIVVVVSGVAWISSWRRGQRKS